MNIYIFSDESGVFDVENNEYFVFAGVIYLSYEERNVAIRRYTSAENNIRQKNNLSPYDEPKACVLKNASKLKLFKTLKQTHKFGVVIDQKKVNRNFFRDKRDKQRYLDYVFKIALKRKLEDLIRRKIIVPSDVRNIVLQVDQHSTATNGRYELEEGLSIEFKRGTTNFKWNTFYPPLFPNMNRVTVKFMDSRDVPLIRAADIVANRLYYFAVNEKDIGELETDMFNIIKQP